MALYPHSLSPHNIEPHVLSMFLASVDCFVKHLCSYPRHALFWKARSHPLPWPPSLPQLPHPSSPEESPSQGHAFQI